jgi:hypothetical protein
MLAISPKNPLTVVARKKRWMEATTAARRGVGFTVWNESGPPS